MAPYLTLMNQDAPHRTYDLREVFNGLRWRVQAGLIAARSPALASSVSTNPALDSGRGLRDHEPRCAPDSAALGGAGRRPDHRHYC